MANLDQELRDIIEYAYANAPAFRQIMDTAGLAPAAIQGVPDLPKIPVTSKDGLVEMQQKNPPFGGWLAVPLNQLQRIYFSPGPLYDPQGFGEENGAMGAMQALQAAELVPGDIAVNTFLYHMVPAGLWVDEGLKRARVTVVPLGPGNTDLLIMVLMALKANVYIGTPSFLESVYTRAGQMGMAPAALPLRKALFSAEPYLPAQRQKFEGEYGLRTAQAYGTADLGLVGYEKVGRPGFYLPDTLIVEIADPESGRALFDGEPGEVVVTTFNRAYPLIRLGTGDLSIAETDENGVRRLKGILGRSGDAVKVRGMFLHPNQLKLLAGAFPQIKHIAAVITRQENQDVLKVQIELAEGQEGLNQEAFAEQFGTAFRQQARLRADNIEFVAPGVLDSGGRLVRDERK